MPARRDVDAIRDRALSNLLAPAFRMRLMMTPVLAVIMGVSCWVDPAPWRLALGGTTTGLLAVVAVAEYLRLRLGHTTARALGWNLAGMSWLQVMGVAASGGFNSPLLPFIPALSFQGGVMVGRRPPLGVVLVGQVIGAWAYAILPSYGYDLALPGFHSAEPLGAWRWYCAIALTLMICVGGMVGSYAHEMLSGLVGETLAGRDLEREASEAHAREMEGFAGEIAHELKNPLAAVKGLAALLARDLSGKDSERLAVLRGEVDRMEEVLGSFLDLARPLQSLTLAEVDGRALAVEVAASLEGLARSKGVQVACDGGATLRGDRRKLRQVLVNLTKNAIEASPEGQVVELRVTPVGAGARVAVSDRGTGIPSDLPAFEAGVTTKPAGDGLGLTIARALARQHGGELRLDPRTGGGTTAVLELPGSSP